MGIKREKKEIEKGKKEAQKMKTNSNKIGTVKVLASFCFGLLWFSLLLFTMVADPIIMMLKAYLQVSNGSFVHEFMLREVEGIHVSTHIFNVTNADRFIAGDDVQLKVDEVGPFTYREIRSNEDVVIDTENQRLIFTPKTRLEFVLEESIGRPEDVNVTVPNIPMLGLASKMSEYSYWTRMGFNLLTTQLKSRPIVTVSASDYLWGYDEPLISLAHTLIPGSIYFDKMGILDRIYDSKNRNRLEVTTGEEEKFMIKKINGHKRLKMDDAVDPDMCTQCNTLENTFEGIGYPLGFPPDYPIRIFRNGLCRILDLNLEKQETADYGGKVLVYSFSDNFYTLDPNVTSSGVLPLPECFMGIPLAFSKPHFLDVDPSAYERIDGINPDYDKHKSWVTIDPRLGLQLETVFSLQINLVVDDVSSNQEAKSFSNMVLPICYLRIEQPPLPEDSKVFLNGVYRTGPYLILGIQLLSFVLMSLSWGYFARAVYKNLLSKSNTMICFPETQKVKEINSNIVEEPLMPLTHYQKIDENILIHKLR